MVDNSAAVAELRRLAQQAHVPPNPDNTMEVLRAIRGALGPYSPEYVPWRAEQEMSPLLAQAMAESLARLRERYPNTVGGIKFLEPTSGPEALSHHRGLWTAGRPDTKDMWALGYVPNESDLTIGARALGSQLSGHLASNPLGEGALDDIVRHEVGHGVDSAMLRAVHGFATDQGARRVDLAPQDAMHAYREFQQQNIADALAGGISGYSRDAARIAVQRMAENGVPIDMRGAQIPEVLGRLTTEQLHTIGREPFAEQFVKNGGEAIAPLEDIMQRAGWRGEVSPNVAIGGAGLGAALLAAPIIAQHVGGRWGNAINGAATGAGIGGMFGAGGALAGAGIGALASQLFG